jgi:hypothetical protein
MANREWQGRDDEPQRWRRDEQWSPYDRPRDEGWRGMRDDFRGMRDEGRGVPYGMRDERRGMPSDYRGYPRESGFGYGGMDRGFRGGGYGGYGGYGLGGMGGYFDRSMRDDERNFFGPGSGMLDRGGWQENRRMGRAPRGYQRSDERIKEDICDRLMHSWVDAENVEIEVKQGEVTLSGTVDERRMKRMIEDICDDVLGVKDVQNRIRVGQQQQQQQTTTQRKPTA